MILTQEKREVDELRSFWPRIYRYYAIHYPFYRMEMHSHREWEIMYVVSGRCRVSCQAQDGNGKEYDLREGDYILLGGMVPHRLTVEKQSPCRILNLEGRLERASGSLRLGQLLGESSFERLLRSRERVLTGTDDGKLCEAISSLIRELREQKELADAGRDGAFGPMADLFLGQFLLLVARQMDRQRSRKDKSRYIRLAQRYLEENFDREVTVAQTAEAAGVSEGYLQRLFKKETGLTIKEEILRLRVEKAKLLLETSSLPVVEVAINAGFNSRQHFSEVFRRATGAAPASWRRMHGNVAAKPEPQ
ncbi:MAG: AraC family transcriptional regulator [Eubacteriales bacterium]|nr:AraC family transcriptional regulator [Eubacteriales bacterium]